MTFDPDFIVQVVSHVCTVWRSVALSGPSLWTTLDVDDSIKMGLVLAH